MKNKEPLIFWGTIAFIVIMIGTNITLDKMYINKFQTGEYQLECQMEDGYRLIEPSKIVDVDLDTQTFVFTNGSATNCKVIKGTK